MLDSTSVDEVFEYVRAQTNKIDPVLDEVKRPAFIDQLIESYIADILLFLMEVLGPKRAEEFKKTHLKMQPSLTTPAQMYKSKFDDADLLQNGGNVAYPFG